MSKRIGPRMIAAAEYVAAHPGCTKHEASLAVGPNGSNAYGYRIIQRAIRARLIQAEYHRGRYSLTVTPEALASTS